MVVLKKILKDGISEQVYSQLKENILNGRWKPGDRIPSENQLVSLLGVSRVSIRMAIQRLVTLGLLEAKVGNGTFVKTFSPGSFISELVPIILKPGDQLEVMEFRKALETEALRLAAKRATNEELRELENIHHKARNSFKIKDLDSYFKEDMQFHMQIFRMSKNGLFISTIQTIGSLLFQHFYSVAKDFFETRTVPSDEADLHTVILSAIMERNVEKCANTYAQLMDELISMYRKLQEERAVMDSKSVCLSKLKAS